MNLNNKIYFVSLGCSRNLVDTEVMLGIVLRSGYEVASTIEESDYLVVNTCGFLEASRKESCETIDSLFLKKKQAAKVIVVGCMVQKYGDEIRSRFPNVHYFLGSGDMEKILEALETETPGHAVTNARSYLEWGEIPRKVSTPKHYAYLKIAEGCAKRCSFCIIPSIKGVLKSKSHLQVIKEFNLLLKGGAKEIILIAQDLGDYGKDRKEKNGLVELLKEMLKVEGDYWIRLLYLYPDEITEELVELLATDSRICRYLDMPIQHINDTILKAMRRKTSKKEIVDILQMLRTRFPEIVIRTSLMVGFPGETEEQFEELLDFIGKHPLDNVGIFKYSKEKESHSAKLEGHLSEEIKQDRFERLVEAQMKMVKKRNKSYVGRRLKVVVEGYHPDSELLMKGRFYGQCPEIDGQIIINDGRLVTEFGEFYEVEISGFAEYDLIGTVIARSTNLRKKNTLALYG